MLTDKEKLEIYHMSIESLKNITKIQCSPGNWDYDPPFQNEKSFLEYRKNSI